MKYLGLFLLLLCSHVYSADWPHWRGPAYDGISEEALPARLSDSLPILWTAKVGTGFSTVSVVGDKVFTQGNRTVSGVEKDTVWCLSAKTGKVIWFYTYDSALDPLYYEGGPSATPTVHEGAVYTLSKRGRIFRLDINSGRVQWSRDLVAEHELELPEWGFASSPFVAGDRLLLNLGGAGIALDLKSGETLWLSNTATAGYATVVPYPAGGKEASRLIFSGAALHAVNPEDGKVAWTLPWKTSRGINAADPIVLGKRIVVSSASGTALIEPGSGGAEPSKIWEQKDLKWYFNPGVLIDGHLYSLHGTTHRPTELTCVDVATGKIVWSEPDFNSGGLVASGRSIILFDQGTLTIFEADPKGYRPRFQQKILEGKCWTSPVFANGQIYCRNAEGELAAVGVGELE